MDTFVARTALVPSSVSQSSRDGYCGEQIADAYRGAHADGFDYADYQHDQLEWAKMVWDTAGTPLEGYLFLAAARDYAEHKVWCEDRNEQPLPRGKWCEAHVAGQIDRALEIAGEI
jgi:hypothetical protein